VSAPASSQLDLMSFLAPLLHEKECLLLIVEWAPTLCAHEICYQVFRITMGASTMRLLMKFAFLFVGIVEASHPLDEPSTHADAWGIGLGLRWCGFVGTRGWPPFINERGCAIAVRNPELSIQLRTASDATRVLPRKLVGIPAGASHGNFVWCANHDATYAPTVALAVSLHGPFSPLVLTQRSM